MAAIKDENAESRVGFPSVNVSMSTLVRQKRFEFTEKSIRMAYGKEEQ